jgi:hypothetical protein
MKIRLLTDGGYNGMENVKFPVIVTGFPYGSPENCMFVYVLSDELLRIGKTTAIEGEYPFALGTECEIVEDDI